VTQYSGIANHSALKFTTVTIDGGTVRQLAVVAFGSKCQPEETSYT